MDEFGFLDRMSEEYEKYRKENDNPLGEIWLFLFSMSSHIDFCSSALRNDMLTVIDKAVLESGKSDQVRQQQTQITNVSELLAIEKDKVISS